MELPQSLFETKRYLVYWQGNLPLHQVKTQYDPDLKIALSKKEYDEIENYWQLLRSTNKHVEDLPLYRVISINRQQSGLMLRLGLTGYKEYQGTNIQKPYWALSDPMNKMANPLAISAVAVTVDNYIILQFRASLVGESCCHWHVTPSGHVHPPQSIYEGLLAELKEELDVDSSEITGDVTVTGFVVNKENFKPEMTFVIRLKVPVNELLKRSAIDRWEYKKLQNIQWDSKEVYEWLVKREVAWAPPGHAAVLLAGRIYFGENWFTIVQNQIRV